MHQIQLVLSRDDPHERQASQNQDTHLASVSLGNRSTSNGTQSLTQEGQRRHKRRQPWGKFASACCRITLTEPLPEALHALDSSKVANIVTKVEGAAAHVPGEHHAD